LPKYPEPLRRRRTDGPGERRREAEREFAGEWVRTLGCSGAGGIYSI